MDASSTMFTIWDCAHGVVKIGESVRKAGPQLQKRRCRSVQHASVAVRRTRTYTLEEAENRSYLRLPVQCGNQVSSRRFLDSRNKRECHRPKERSKGCPIRSSNPPRSTL
jgi:hypothetical protein